MKYVVFFCLLILNVSCLRKPLEPLEVRRVPIDPECFEYFGAFKEGSEYIYQEETSGEIDTMRVVLYRDLVRVVDTFKSYKQIHNQTIFINYVCTRSYNFMTSISTIDSSNFRFNLYYDVSGGFGFVYKENGNFVLSERLKLLDTVTIFDKTYTNVLWMQDNSSGYKELYFAKNYGLIKKVDLFNRVYALKSAKINF